MAVTLPPVKALTAARTSRSFRSSIRIEPSLVAVIDTIRTNESPVDAGRCDRLPAEYRRDEEMGCRKEPAGASQSAEIVICCGIGFGR